MAQQLKMLRNLDEIPEVYTPEGFFVRNFREGEEDTWVEICKHGLASESAGRGFWEGSMLVIPTLVPERDVFFICTEDGTPVATFAGYIMENGIANMHMVAALESARGHGLGKTVVTHILAAMKKQMPGKGRLMGLRTDDWRIPAVVGYLKGGFHPVLYDEGMQERWQAVCDNVNIHGVEMWDENGNPTGIIL